MFYKKEEGNIKNKKKIFIFLVIILMFFIALVVIYSHETSDLVCYRHSPDYLDSDKKDYIIFNFNWIGRISKYW